ncbi:nitroreductase family protein [Halobacteriovorax sp. JY17]|uniref:nitroreductase family protein n=1 Tax=Halobacteriovorax sp. JY17 TaxID=2014617 RepID=UPI000C35EB05|nr:nitroreductase family protein [Halobacteriovorax sp. JY17]PIK16278.1 MAG: nitroreductase family protein [Halobacteriovorax sp. JY17]
MSNDIFSEVADTGYREELESINSEEFFKVLKSRRSVRVYKDEPVKEEDMQKILDAAVLAPNSSNLQPWEFYWVKNATKKAELVKACLSQPAAATAPELIVCIARTDTWRENAKTMLEFLNKKEGVPAAAKSYYEKLVPLAYSQGPLGVFGLIKRLAIFITGFKKVTPREPVSKSQMITWATKSTALGCENIMLAARALGYDSCPMEGADSKRIKNILHLGSGAHFVMVISIGKRDDKGVYGEQIRFDRSHFVKILE